MKPKSIVAGMVLIAAVIGVGFALFAWKRLSSGGGNHMMGGGPPPESVKVVAAVSEPWQPMGRLVGTVVAKRSIYLANEVVGVITSVGFESGEIVEPGHVLVELDATTEKADLAAAQAAVRLAEAAINVAEADVRVAQTEVDWNKANYDRYKGAPAKAVSVSDVDRARTDLEAAQSALERQKSVLQQRSAELDQARARVDQIRTIISKKTLKSPFRARAGVRTVHPGQYLAEGSQIVALVELTDEIYLDFAIPQEYTPLVIPGTAVTAKSNILGRGDANTVQIFVISMDATVNPVTRNVRVRTSVPNKDQALKPGMFVDVEVPIGPERPSVTVPTTAVRRAAFGDHIFVLTPPAEGKDAMPGSLVAHQRMVELGTNLGDRVIITKGLEAGEQVAAAGSFKLREGSVVLPAPPEGAPPPPSEPAQTTSSR